MEQSPDSLHVLGEIIADFQGLMFPYDVPNEAFILFCSLFFFQGKFHGNPMHVAVVISNCLREERRILAAANMPVQVISSELIFFFYHTELTVSKQKFFF